MYKKPDIFPHPGPTISVTLMKNEPDRQDLILSVIAYATICFCRSLWGHKGFLVDLQGLCSHMKGGKYDLESLHMVVPLLGRFKNEVGERYHLILLASVTKSGLKPRELVEESLIGVRELAGHTQGPAFCDKLGHKEKSSVYNEVVLEGLMGVQARHPDLIPD